MHGRADVRLVLAFAALTLAAALGVLRLWSSAPAEEPAAFAADAGSLDPTAATAPAIDSPVARAELEIERDLEDGPWWRPPGEPALSPRPPVERGRAVRVIDGASGRPEPESIVLVLQEHEWQIPAIASGTLAGLRESRHAFFLTDGAGETRVPVNGVRSHLVAWKQDRWAVSPFEFERRDVVELRLRRAEELKVRVVGADGVPREGVPLRFGRVVSFPEDPRWFFTVLAATSGPDGIASFRAVERFPESPHPVEWGVTLDVVSKEWPLVKVARSAVPREPLDLVVPPLGRLQVRVVDGTGAPTAYDGTARVQASGAFFPEMVAPELTVRGGNAQPLVVGVGLRFEGSLVGATMTRRRGPVPGPTADGETTTVDVELPRSGWVEFVGNAVDESLQPRAGELEVLIRPLRRGRGGGQRRFVKGTAGEDGAFRFGTSRDVFEFGPAELTIRLTDRAGDPLLSNLVEVEARDSGEVIELNDVVLRSTPPLASGVVVDEDGAPVEGAILHVVSQKDGGREPLPTDLWATDSTTTDGDGRFRFSGRSARDELRLEVWHQVDGWPMSASVVIPEGNRDVRVVLKARGGAIGSVRIPEDVSTSDLVVLGRREDVPSRFPSSWPHSTQVDRGGRFAFRDLEPGSWSIAVARRPQEDRPVPIRTVERVEVRSRDYCEDPRLEGIDLREAIRNVTIEVLEASGEPASHGVLLVFDRGSIGSPANCVASMPLAGKPVTVLLDSSSSDLLLRVPRHRTRWLTDVRRNETVQLEQGIDRTLMLRLAPVPELAAGHDLLVLLETLDVPWNDASCAESVVDPEGRAQLSIQDPGRYRLHLEGRPRGMPGRGVSLPTDLLRERFVLEPNELTIAEGDDPRPIPLRVVLPSRGE